MTKALTTEADVYGALKRRYPAPQYAVLPGVHDATGWKGGKQQLDAVVMSLWPSRGLTLYAVEIKVHRSDWLRELKQPEKQERLFQFFDGFLVAVGDANIVKSDELPRGWGLLVPHGKSMRVEVEPKHHKNKPITREFLAAILRRAAEVMVSPELEQRVRAELEEKYKKTEEEWSATADEALRLENAELKRLYEQTRPIREALNLTQWTDARKIRSICDLIRTFQRHGIDNPVASIRDRLRYARNNFEGILTNFDAAITALDEYEQKHRLSEPEEAAS